MEHSSFLLGSINDLLSVDTNELLLINSINEVIWGLLTLSAVVPFFSTIIFHKTDLDKCDNEVMLFFFLLKLFIFESINVLL